MGKKKDKKMRKVELKDLELFRDELIKSENEVSVEKTETNSEKEKKKKNEIGDKEEPVSFKELKTTVESLKDDNTSGESGKETLSDLNRSLLNKIFNNFGYKIA